jgi:hypothetical protein
LQVKPILSIFQKWKVKGYFKVHYLKPFSPCRYVCVKTVLWFYIVFGRSQFLTDFLKILWVLFVVQVSTLAVEFEEKIIQDGGANQFNRYSETNRLSQSRL